MNFGEMRHRITIQRIVPVINENGFESTATETYKTVWAAVTNLHGKEYFAAKAVQAENTVKFTFRFIEGIDQTMKILFHGKAYNISTIDNIKYRNQYIEVQAMEVEPGG